MTDLPTRIEAGEATDAEVATALGYERIVARGRYNREVPTKWWKIDGRMSPTPPFMSCLTTLAKECERRGYWWNVGHVMGPKPIDQNMFWARCHPKDAKWPYAQPIASTPALALCSALVRAAQETSDA